MPAATRFRQLVRLVLVVAFVVASSVAAAFGISEAKLHATFAAPAASVMVPTDIASLQRGQHLAGAIAVCTRCHGANFGGGVVLDDRSMRVVAPNLTGAGLGDGFRDDDYVHAIRDGIDPRGHELWLMPTDGYAALSDADLGALIAYLKSLPPVGTTLPSSELRPPGRAFLALGQLPLLPTATVNHAAPRPPAPSQGVSPEYGAYLARIADCARCHGPGLSGGSLPRTVPGPAPAANITRAGIGDWSEADFLNAMRTGRRPDGRPIDVSMPWPYYAQMSDVELRAIWQYLQDVPPRPTGTH